MGKYSLEVLELRDRVQQGNKKLTEAWPQIRTITDEGKRVHHGKVPAMR